MKGRGQVSVTQTISPCRGEATVCMITKQFSFLCCRRGLTEHTISATQLRLTLQWLSCLNLTSTLAPIMSGSAQNRGRKGIIGCFYWPLQGLSESGSNISRKRDCGPAATVSIRNLDRQYSNMCRGSLYKWHYYIPNRQYPICPPPPSNCCSRYINYS